MLKTHLLRWLVVWLAYHLGEGRVLKTFAVMSRMTALAYHLGEGRVLKTYIVQAIKTKASVSPWGRARAQDHARHDAHAGASVSPWGRARAQDLRNRGNADFETHCFNNVRAEPAYVDARRRPHLDSGGAHQRLNEQVTHG